MLNIILILAGALLFSRIMNYIMLSNLESQTVAKKCNEIGLPHQWERKDQPWEGMEGEAPTYLQCKKCGIIFGHN